MDENILGIIDSSLTDFEIDSPLSILKCILSTTSRKSELLSVRLEITNASNNGTPAEFREESVRAKLAKFDFVTSSLTPGTFKSVLSLNLIKDFVLASFFNANVDATMTTINTKTF